MAQTTVEEVLQKVEQNNTTLKAIREEGKAQKLGNRTGIYLPGPEVSFNYLWGSPKDIGKRKDFSASQTFDFATLAGIKSKTAKEKNKLVDFQYETDRMTLLLQTKQICMDLIYYNTMKAETEKRLENAREMSEAYKKSMTDGNSNMLDYNKARLSMSTIEGELDRILVERDALLAELRRLNGGLDIRFDKNTYSSISLPENFEQWLTEAEQKNPTLSLARQQISVSKREVKLSRAEGLPSLSAGYMMEKTMGEKFQGITLGISIPLWENKNKVKQAKATVRAAESRHADAREQFGQQLRNLYLRTKGLQKTADRHKKTLLELNNKPLLDKALQVGQINLLDYLVEIGLYYETVNQYIAAERDYQKAYVELTAFEL